MSGIRMGMGDTVLFSIGLHAEVMEPEILRQEIGQLAKQLYQQYEIDTT